MIYNLLVIRYLKRAKSTVITLKKKKKKLASAYAQLNDSDSDLTLSFLLLQLRIVKSARTHSLATALRPAADRFV